MSNNNNIIPFPGFTYVELDAASMLVEIAKEKPKHAVVITWDENPAGNGEGWYGDYNIEPHFHSSSPDPKEIYWYLMLFAKVLQEDV